MTEPAVSTDKGAADYSIWSFCYAKGQVPRDFIEGAPVGSNQGLLQIPMLYSAIVAPPSAARRSALLVDTGFTAARSMTGRTFADFETPAEVLTKVELEPHDVQTILLTHMHFDHAGGIDSFPDATILLQRSEYEGWKRALKTLPNQAPSKSSWVLSSTNLDDVERLDRALADGRLTLIDGDREVWPGITLRLAADTHTFGSQWIEVSTPAGPYVIAGDAVVSFANLERMWPPGYHQGNAWKLLEAYASIKQAVGGDWARRVVPGHDMELFRRFPSAIFAGNPLAEVHLAAGQRSFLPAS
jgi:glyoxylase-like metal-dependent hydrolase (beta-lactamase superfamily II)